MCGAALPPLPAAATAARARDGPHCGESWRCGHVSARPTAQELQLNGAREENERWGNSYEEVVRELEKQKAQNREQASEIEVGCGGGQAPGCRLWGAGG